VHQNHAEPWKITLVDTGDETMTGGRLLAVRDYLDPNEAFCLTYGDGVAAIDVGALVDFHRAQGRRATITAVTPPGRFGALQLEEDKVIAFSEKPDGDGGRINGGFFVLDPTVLDLIDGPDCVWERGPLERLAADGELAAFRHDGFWQPMDTLRDKLVLEELWTTGRAPWKLWDR
jgi:glucose-1-phosphate cytidylyltransferase